ncbi:MAG: nucleotide exchange factor GrpE [Bacteroidales bacterium]|nr:nucleotide exchange factor GrpE [Bacteroidales bacterium]MBD5302180.1 nucleotide exchange factor GrpE [Bacteroides sp.]
MRLLIAISNGIRRIYGSFLTFIGTKFATNVRDYIHKEITQMKDMNNNEFDNRENTVEPEEVVVDDVNSTPAAEEIAEGETAQVADDALSEEEKLAKENQSLKDSLEKEKKEYMFLMAEFDNFRKRTLREKSELIKNAAESVFKGLLPVVDDMERALKASENSEDANSIREGMELIYKKLVKFMDQNGVKAMDPEDKEFNADIHEAITAVPVPDEAQKGKIIDTVEKGYTINGKVLRHAKVVVGQ